MSELSWQSFADIRVAVQVVLPTTSLPLDTLAALEVGAIVPLGLAITAPCQLVVNGLALAMGVVVTRRGNRAFALKEVL